MQAAFLGIDTETTGLDASIHQVIQIYLVLLNEQLEALDELHVYAYPSDDAVLDAKAIEVNGYTKEKWQEHGAVDQRTMANLVYAFVSKHKRLKCIAHNTAFDTAFLKRVYNGAASVAVPYDNAVGYHHVDTIPITIFMDLAAKAPLRKSYSLVNLSKDYQIPHEHAHSAKSDLLACIDLLKRHIETAQGLLSPIAVVEKRGNDGSNGFSRIIKKNDAGDWVFQYGTNTGRKVAEIAVEKPGYIRYVLGFNDLNPEHKTYLESLIYSNTFSQ